MKKLRKTVSMEKVDKENEGDEMKKTSGMKKSPSLQSLTSVFKRSSKKDKTSEYVHCPSLLCFRCNVLNFNSQQASIRITELV
jgi:hypothetical protein